MNLENRHPKIYIIAGHARQGKDTVATMIREYYQETGKKSIDVDFAHYIKEYAKIVTDWDGKEETKPREFLQYLGTDLIRKEIDNDFFIRRMIEDIKVFSYFYDIITLSDARFDQEVEIIKKSFPNVSTLKVERPNYQDTLGILGNHSTEHGLVKNDLYDSIIINDESLEQLREKVIKILEG